MAAPMAKKVHVEIEESESEQDDDIAESVSSDGMSHNKKLIRKLLFKIRCLENKLFSHLK